MLRTFAFYQGACYIVNAVMWALYMCWLAPSIEKTPELHMRFIYHYHKFILGLLRIITINIAIVKLSYIVEFLILLIEWNLSVKKDINEVYIFLGFLAIGLFM